MDGGKPPQAEKNFSVDETCRIYKVNNTFNCTYLAGVCFPPPYCESNSPKNGRFSLLLCIPLVFCFPYILEVLARVHLVGFFLLERYRVCPRKKAKDRFFRLLCILFIVGHPLSLQRQVFLLSLRQVRQPSLLSSLPWF